MLCLIVLLAALFALIVAIAAVIVIYRSDGDLLLMFKVRFGKQPESLAGKVVWITGASSGIGEHFAYCLAGAGCRLVLSARRKEELERVKERCLEKGKGKIIEEDIMVLPLNIADFDTHKPAVQNVLETFNKIDILINNAGKSQRADWIDIDISVDRELFEVNVLGPVSLTQTVLPHMIERKQGHIVVTSSIVGKCAFPNSRSYTGSKFALHGYFETLRTEISPYNIDVTLLCPGPVHSNLFVGAATSKPGEALGRPDNPKTKKMATDRCAYLSCVAISNKLYEAWISDQPALSLVYICQYFPLLGQWFLKTMGVKFLMKVREAQ